MSKCGRFYADIMAVNDEVTGSCHLVVVKFPDGETMRFIVDCGLYQEEAYSELNESFPFNPDNLDFCLITHVHVDHVGRLPLLVKRGFNKNIYATETTCKLLPIALRDSFSVLNSVAKRKHISPLYAEKDVDKTSELLTPCSYDKKIKINDNVRVTFFNNGHLVGSASILIEISCFGEENINILFTGDYNNKNVFFDVKPYPDWVYELPLTVVQESTYGNMESKDMHKCFRDNIRKNISNGGTSIVLVFSLGRAQEALYELKLMQQAKFISTDIPIYFDGKLAIRYTELFKKNEVEIKEEMINFLPENLTFVDKTCRLNVLTDNRCKIIVTSSGMGSYGPAQTYIPEYITHKNALIHFMGYTADGTLGAKLKNTEIGETVEVNGLVLKKRANVEYTTEFSAHAKADEMIAFLKQFKKLKLVLVNHGESYTKEIFAKRIVNEVEPKQTGILNRKYFFRVNHRGLVKSLTTKFE